MTYIGFLTANISETAFYTDRTHYLENQTICLVFRTLLQTTEDVNKISKILDTHPGVLCWSLDLENWEKVLKIICSTPHQKKILDLLYENCVGIKELR